MEKKYVQELIDRICTDTENMFSHSPKVSMTKVFENFTLLLELVSLNTEFEERVNRIIQSYYHSEYSEEMNDRFRWKLVEMIFRGKTDNERLNTCSCILNDLGISPDILNERQLFRFIKGGQGSHCINVTDGFKIKLCKYLGLDSSEYVPPKAPYKDYLLERQNELMKLLGIEPEVKPDMQYQGKVREMKDALFSKFSEFVEQTFDKAFEGVIDERELCSETQSLITELKDYRRAANY